MVVETHRDLGSVGDYDICTAAKAIVGVAATGDTDDESESAISAGSYPASASSTTTQRSGGTASQRAASTSIAGSGLPEDRTLRQGRRQRGHRTGRRCPPQSAHQRNCGLMSRATPIPKSRNLAHQGNRGAEHRHTIGEHSPEQSLFVVSKPVDRDVVARSVTPMSGCAVSLSWIGRLVTL
jgi:hypothetical protein